MIYRLATIDDLQQALDFYHRMIDVMHGSEFDVGWRRDVHPSDDYLENSVENGCMIIGCDDKGRILCAVILDDQCASGYERIPWHVDAESDEVGVLHVLATDPKFHRQGLASNLLEATVEYARASDLKAIRLDTFTDNLQGQSLYKKYGFECLGTHELLYEELGPRDFMIFEYDISFNPRTGLNSD